MQRVAFLARRAGRRLSNSAVSSRPGHNSGPLCGTVIGAHNNQASSCGCASCGVASGGRSYGTATNRGVMFMGPNHVEVKDIPFPKLELDSTTSPVVSERQKRKCDHGVIIKVVTTNICGSDQHMVRG